MLDLSDNLSDIVLLLPELLLKPPKKLLILSLREDKVLVRELTVLLFQFAFHFIPTAFEYEFVHV